MLGINTKCGTIGIQENSLTLKIRNMKIYKSLFWLSFTLYVSLAIAAVLDMNNQKDKHETEVYNLNYEIQKLETENKHLRSVQKQYFEEREKARRGSAVKGYKDENENLW